MESNTLGRVGSRIAHPPTPRHAFRRLHTRQQFLPLLIATTVLMLLTVILIGYLAARASAVSAAEMSAGVNAQLAREVIGERGQYPAIVNGQLVASGGANNGANSTTANYPLVNDTWVVDHVRQLTGDLAVVYQLNGATLKAVATNLPQTNAQGRPIANTRATGQQIPANARDAIFGACGAANAPNACPDGYRGTVTIAGVSYVAGFEPLLDQQGHLVGAVGVLEPLDTVLTAPMQLAIVLLLTGLLVGLIVVVVGTWVANLFPNRLLRQLDSQLDTMARAAVELGRLARQQQFRLQHQQRTARQVGDYALKLDALARAMDDGQTALHQTTTAIWEEMSQPGPALNAAMALRLAREAAVRASEVGMASDETRAHARQVIALMNQVIAEGRALAQEGREAESHANELAATLDSMESDLGEQLTPRRYDLGSAPLLRRITAASQRLRQMLQSDGPADDGGQTIPRRRERRTGGGSAPHSDGAMGGARGPMPGLPSLPQHDGSGRFPSAPFRGNQSLSGFPRGDQRGDQPGVRPPASPGASGSRPGGRSGKRPGDASSPPGGLPPLGRFDDDLPPRGPNDSHWLNE